MRLSEWLEKRGWGSAAQLSYDTRISTATISKAVRGERIGQYRIAKKLSEATGGEVSIEELCDPERDE